MREHIVNGIDIGRLAEARRMLRDDAKLAQFRFSAINRWNEGAKCYSTIHDFEVAGNRDTTRPRPFVLEAGEPDVLLGQDNAPNATEAVLHALAACLNTTLIFHASAQGIKIDELEIDLEGDLDLRGFLGITKEVRNGYKNIRITFKVKADADEDKIRELCELAQEYSPVFDIIRHGVPISANVEPMKTKEVQEAPLRSSV